jgi:hypothetical protein
MNRLVALTLLGCISACGGTGADPAPPPGFPDASTTGVPAGTVLVTYRGPCTWRSGQAPTLDGVDATGCEALVTYVPGLKIVNSRVPRVETEDAGSVELSDTTIEGGTWVDGTLWGSNIVATRVEITGGQHSVHCGSGCTVTDSWLHEQYNPDGGATHNNAFLSNGGTDITLRHNTLHCTPRLNATGGGCSGDLSLFGDFEPISHVTVEDNLLKANDSSVSYCAYAGWEPSKEYPIPDHIAFTGNVFERGPSGKCGVYGAITSWYQGGTNTWSGNAWDDGTPLSP